LSGAPVPREEVLAALAEARTELTDATTGYRDRYLEARQAVAVGLGLGSVRVVRDPWLFALGCVVFGGLVVMPAGWVLTGPVPWLAPVATTVAAGAVSWMVWLALRRTAARSGGGREPSVRRLGRVQVCTLAAFLAAVGVAAALGASGSAQPGLIALAGAAALGLLRGIAIRWRTFVHAATWAVLESDDPARWRAAGRRGCEQTLRVAEQALNEWLDALARAGSRALASWLSQVTAPRSSRRCRRSPAPNSSSMDTPPAPTPVSTAFMLGYPSSVPCPFSSDSAHSGAGRRHVSGLTGTPQNVDVHSG